MAYSSVHLYFNSVLLEGKVFLLSLSPHPLLPIDEYNAKNWISDSHLVLLWWSQSLSQHSALWVIRKIEIES